MTDNTLDDAAAALTDKTTLSGVWHLNGESYPLEVEEATLGELEALETELGEEADEVDMIRRMIDEYLVKPEVDADNIGTTKLHPLFEGVQRCWMQEDAFETAEEAMPVEGNQ